jgi:hypothetical protein
VEIRALEGGRVALAEKELRRPALDPRVDLEQLLVAGTEVERVLRVGA